MKSPPAEAISRILANPRLNASFKLIVPERTAMTSGLPSIDPLAESATVVADPVTAASAALSQSPELS